MNRLQPGGCRPSAGALRFADCHPSASRGGAVAPQEPHSPDAPAASLDCPRRAGSATPPFGRGLPRRSGPSGARHAFPARPSRSCVRRFGERAWKGQPRGLGGAGASLRGFDVTDLECSPLGGAAKLPLFSDAVRAHARGVKQGSSSRNGPTVGRGTRGRMGCRAEVQGKSGVDGRLPALRGRRHGTRAPRGGAAKRRTR